MLSCRAHKTQTALLRAWRDRSLFRTFLLLCVLCSRSALAESNADARRADVLFDQGFELLEAKRFDEACAVLEESLKLERAVGTLLNLGRCYEALRRPASAFLLYRTAAEESEKAGDLRRAQLARQRRDAVDRAAPRVLLIFPENEPSLRIKIDGNSYDRALINDLRLDPGIHGLEVTREEAEPPSIAKILVPERSAESPTTTFVIVLPARQEATRSAATPVARLDDSPAESPLAPEQKPSRPARLEPAAAQGGGAARVLAWSGVTLGLATLAAGVTLGTVAIMNADASDCENLECSAAGLDDRQRAKEQLDVAYGMGIAGGLVAVGSAAFLLLSQPEAPGHPSARVRPIAQVHLGGFRLGLSYRF